MQPNYIAGYDQMGGLIERVKPFKLPDQAFATLDNAYIYRDRVEKRDPIELLARLRRVVTGLSETATQNLITYTDTDLLNSVRATEPSAEIQPGSVTITIRAGDPNETIFDDSGADGVLVYVSGTYTGSGTINYITGRVVITWTAINAGGFTVDADLSYYPTLPSMGIRPYEQATINVEVSVFFDTKYAYIFTAGNFQELATGTTWAGTDHDFFWTTNYRGSNSYDRLFFVTNNVNSAANPMRYYDGTWHAFTPRVVSGGGTLLLTALILLPYYGRLIALNVTEGAALGAGNTIVNRCRFSQVGSPVAVDAWDTDVFGKGGFIDAPTSEAIVCASFVKNSLVVRFERSTWQLRYNGDYGLPFIWERISSDFGGESTFSDVIFDDGVLSVGNRAITVGNGSSVQRIDELIPDKVFSISNTDNGPSRVYGVKEYERELVYWCYPEWADTDDQGSDEPTGYFPSKVLIYNYINKSWATFRDNVTCFGLFQRTSNITWDSTETIWDSLDVMWDDVDTQAYFPSVVSGNQQGYIHFYNSSTKDNEDPSLAVTAISSTVITIPNHNLANNDYIGISPGLWTGTAPVQSGIFTVTVLTVDTIDIGGYVIGTGDYIGGAEVTLYPQMYIQTKDFNPYLPNLGNLKLIYVDFLMDFVPDGEFHVEVFVNTSNSVQANVNIDPSTQLTQQNSETNLPAPYYVPASDIAWHRFYATAQGQFVRIVMTYSDEQMKTLAIHQQDFTLNAMRFWTRAGGSTIF